jgi:hypothetical protein
MVMHKARPPFTDSSPASAHYAGHGPATIKQFWDLWEKK